MATQFRYKVPVAQTGWTIQGQTEVDSRAPDQPPAQTRVVLPLEKIVFPHAGRYRFRLRAGPSTVEALPLFVATRS